MREHPTQPDGAMARVRVTRPELPIDKAARLMREGRVSARPEARVYLVEGDSASYRVIADSDGIFCPCRAHTPLCSHVLAAAHMRERERLGEFSVKLNGNGNGAVKGGNGNGYGH